MTQEYEVDFHVFGYHEKAGSLISASEAQTAIAAIQKDITSDYKTRIAELEKERESLLRLISYVKSIVFSKVKCSYVSFRRPLEELLKDQSNG
jgi:hypothetical protein